MKNHKLVPRDGAPFTSREARYLLPLHDKLLTFNLTFSLVFMRLDLPVAELQSSERFQFRLQTSALHRIAYNMGSLQPSDSDPLSICRRSL